MNSEPEYQGKYKIVRMFINDDVSKRTIKRGLTWDQVQAHCNDPETSSQTCTSKAAQARTARFGNWFDGWEYDN